MTDQVESRDTEGLPAAERRPGGGDARTEGNIHSTAPTAHPVEAIKLLGSNFAERFSAAATKMLAVDVEVRFASLARLPRNEFHGCLASLACWYAYGHKDNEAVLVYLGLDDSAAGGMLNTMLGGSVRRDGRHRKMTAIDRRLLGRVMDIAAEALAGSWTVLGSLGRQGAPAETTTCDMISAMCFNLGPGPLAGTMRLFIPTTVPAEAPADTKAPRGKAGPIELSATAGEGEIPPEQLAELAAGDIIATDTAVDGEIIVRLAGIPKFAGQLSTCNGKRAISLTRKLTGPDDTPSEK
ncbi:MAG: FliM/FliN family flagellar motor switch protein [Phycisphaerae bacterium]|jgi:flagellar motor switch protein FliM|nr:FliM/FliN family flagellar motor switch protein [Phycisphaerae bacterium]MDP7635973.1 FliM/FliN family flagellar motor switch protein [Phycisphaerae bacterium]